MAVRCALKLASLLFVRPGELSKAEWSEFNRESYALVDTLNYHFRSARMPGPCPHTT